MQIHSDIQDGHRQGLLKIYLPKLINPKMVGVLVSLPWVCGRTMIHLSRQPHHGLLALVEKCN